MLIVFLAGLILLSSLAFALASDGSARVSGFVIVLLTWDILVVFNGSHFLLEELDAISLVHQIHIGFPVGRLMAV